MQTNPESAAVEAVAWAMTDYQADGANTQFTRDRHAAEYWGEQGIQIDPLYPQSALDALRGEVDQLRGALERIAAPHDCGCKPCTSTCRSDLALQITVEAMREEAIEALTKESP